MNNSLDVNLTEFRKLLNQSSELVIGQFEDLESKKAYHFLPQKEVERWSDEPLPQSGMDSRSYSSWSKNKVMDTATNNVDPYMYACVMAGGTQISVIAEQPAATINQNVGKWHLVPAINEIERRVIQWGGEPGLMKTLLAFW